MSLKQYNLSDSLGYLTRQLNQLILKAIAKDFVSDGISITSEQWIVLVLVWAEGGQTQRAITEKLYKDKAWTTRLLHDLEAMGLIYRLSSQQDSREKFTYLTDEGKDVMDRATKIVQGVLNKAYAGVDPEELNICRRVLRQSSKNLS